MGSNVPKWCVLRPEVPIHKDYFNTKCHLSTWTLRAIACEAKMPGEGAKKGWQRWLVTFKRVIGRAPRSAKQDVGFPHGPKHRIPNTHRKSFPKLLTFSFAILCTYKHAHISIFPKIITFMATILIDRIACAEPLGFRCWAPVSSHFGLGCVCFRMKL